MSGGRLTPLLAVPGALLVLFLALPIVGLAAGGSAGSLFRALLQPEVRSALWISTSAASVSTLLALVGGVPLGYLLARRDFPGRELLQGVVDMPVVVPHVVAGIALLVVLSPSAPVGAAAGELGLSFVDAFPGTVVAMLFVSAPFTINAARSGFEAVEPRLEKVSRSLGAGASRTFLEVSLPLAGRTIAAGAVMSWARAVSEFGAVLIIAYFPRSAPTLVYERLQSSGLEAARPVALLLVGLCLVLFALVRIVLRRPGRPEGERTHAEH
ncbi:MAG: ABC transporter permease [Planctomycetota bacterium]